MKVRVELRVLAGLAEGLPPPPGVRVATRGDIAVAEVEAADLREALVASEAWLALLRGRRK